MTFKSVTEVLRAHGEALKEIENALPAKANKVDMAQQMIGKANVSDVSRTIAEVATNIESRVTFEEMHRLLEQKMSRSDVQVS